MMAPKIILCVSQSDESFKLPSTPDNSLNVGIAYFDNSRIKMIFHGNYLKLDYHLPKKLVLIA